MASERLEVQRTIPADPATVFRLLCDPQGHVAIDSSGMLMTPRASPDRRRRQLRRAHGSRGPQRRPQIGRVYGYVLEPVADGTLVTSYYDWSSIDPTWKKAGIFPVIPEGALRATLGILARTVARSRGISSGAHP